jgi:hypothetical protein
VLKIGLRGHKKKLLRETVRDQKRSSSMLQQLDRQMEQMCEMENTSKVIKFVNNGFHIIKTYSHIPGTFRNSSYMSRTHIFYVP